MQRIVSALVVIVVGGLLTVTAFLMVKNWEKEAVESALIRNSIVGAYSLKIQMEQHLLLTRSLEGLFASSEHVSREEFNRFGDALLDNTDNVIGVGWLPRVSLAERETYERELGEIVGGQKGIWERNASGEPSNAGVREEYFPLYFATPFDVSKKVFGFDFLSSPTAVEAMTLARDTGELTVTDEIRPAIGGRQQSRILTFMPYYENGVFPQDLDDRRKGLQGFVIGSHQIDNIMDSSLSASGGEGVNYYLYDGTLPDRRKFLYAYGRGNNHAPVAMADLLRSGGHHVVPIEVGNRKWDLVAEATPEFVAIKSSWRPSIALLIGTLFTLLLAAFIDKITTSSLRAKLLATQEGKVRQQAETALAEQHRTELALRESERKFRMIFNNSYELIGLLGLDGTLLDANDTSLEFAGCSKSEVLNRPFWETAWWSHSPELQEQLRTAIDQAATGKMVKFETTHPAENGRGYTVDFSISPLFDEQGQVVLLIPEGRDITERKEMEQKLQSSENDLRMLIDQSPIGLTLCTLDGNIVQANPAYARITGYSSDEILQLSIGEITPKKYTDQEQHKIDQLLTTGRFGPYEKEYRHKAGHLVPVRVNGILIDKGGEKFIWASVEDVAALKTAETEAYVLAEQLRQAQKMEAIGTLAGGIAHDFNNILSAVLGYTELTLRNPSCDPKAQRNLQYVLSAAERGRDLVKQILLFSRKEEENRKQLAIGKVVDEAVNLLRKTIPSTIPMRLDISPVGWVLGDETQIQQVIMNLCTNAFHSLPNQGGEISVGVKQIQLDQAAAERHPTLAAGSYAMLTVADNGTGIQPQVLMHIFDPFFTTKELGKGTGLGLSVVHGIVKRHGGSIDVQSEVGKGTTFSIFLPLVAGAKEPDASADFSSELRGGSECLLWVDDEPMLKELGEEMLQLLGYQVTATTSANEALEVFKKNPHDFDLLITDQTMPEMSGSELAVQALSIRPDLPVVLCTGHSDVLNRKKALSLGARSLLMKPLESAILAKEIRTILDEES